MKLGQMFPSKYLAASDLEAGKFMLVTIAEIDWIDVSMHKDSPDDPDAAYIMKLREFKKPMKLNRTNANTIATVLKSDDTDDWAGRQIRIFPTQAQFGNQTFPVIRVDFNPVHGGALPPRNPGATLASPATASSLPATFDTKPVGQKNAAAFMAALAEQGKRTDDFLRWAKLCEREIHDLCYGREINDWPRGGATLMQRYLREIPPDTGPENPNPAPPVEPPPDDDIPF